MKPLVALLVALSLAACFPHNAKHRQIAKISEGVAIASGIALLYTVNSGADCDEMRTVADETSSGCRGNADMLGGIGLGLILGGLAGFIVTVSTSPDDVPEQPANTLTPTPIAAPAAQAPAKTTAAQ